MENGIRPSEDQAKFIAKPDTTREVENVRLGELHMPTYHGPARFVGILLNGD